jgi:hypothetical protein
MRTGTCVLFSIFSLVAALIFISASCDETCGGSGSGSFTYDGNTYSLTGAGMEDFENGIFELDIVSSSINVCEWTGTGHIVCFELFSSSTPGASGTYDWSGSGGLLFLQVGISLDYNADSGTGTWLLIEDQFPNAGDYLTISASGDTYTFEFSLTMVDSKTVTGGYTGTVAVW